MVRDTAHVWEKEGYKAAGESGKHVDGENIREDVFGEFDRGVEPFLIATKSRANKDAAGDSGNNIEEGGIDWDGGPV